MADNMGRGDQTLSGLTEPEAREFHQLYMQGFLVFTAIAVVAHILVWIWRPWIPGPQGYTSLMNDVVPALSTITSMLA